MIAPKEGHEKRNDPDALLPDVRTPDEIRECLIGDCTCVPQDAESEDVLESVMA